MKKLINSTIIICAIITLSITSSHAQTIVCDGDSLLLDAGQSYTGSIQWQQSNNGVTFNNITGATTDPFMVYFTLPKYYRGKIYDSICAPFYTDTIHVMPAVTDTLEQYGSAGFAGNTFTSIDTSANMAILQYSGAIQYGTGSNGAYSTTVNVNLAGGVYNYTSFTINSGDTVRVTGSSALVINCQGKVTINGVLLLNGNKGGNGDNNLPPGAGGVGTGGGFSGGIGGTGVTSTTITYHGANGQGPGGGIRGITEYVTSLDGQGGGGASYGTLGTNSYHSGGAGGIAGPLYSTAAFINLLGGSGGGGGAGDDDGGLGSSDGGGGGGAGGGAVKISARSIRIATTGAIHANGGNGGSCGNGGSGGGGSGGSIYFEADTIRNQGSLRCLGGTSITAQLANSIGGTGGNGRIRFNYTNSYTNTGTIQPAVGYTGSIIGSFASSGTMETTVFTTTDLCTWGLFSIDANTLASGTSVTADILNSTGGVLSASVTSGTDLATIPALNGVSQIKLKFYLNSTGASSPSLSGWRILYKRK